MWQLKAWLPMPFMGLGLLMAGLSSPVDAQTIDRFLPTAVPGLDLQQGVTVLSRLRPLYEEPGVRLGGFTLHGGLDEVVGYDSNLTGINKGPSDGFIQTSPSVTATSNWSRNRLGLSAGLDNYNYFTLPNQSYTNYNVSVGGGLTIGRHDLNVGYSHLALHERGTDIGVVNTTSPLAYNVEDLRSDYSIDAGRFTFTPNIDLQRYTFGSATVAGQSISQSYRDRNVVTGGFTTRYALSEDRGVLFVVQGSTSQFLRSQPGVPRPNSESVLVLGGLDYQAGGPWRYRLLIGAEFRQFQYSIYGSHAAPLVEANVIYTPTGLTSVTGFVRREIEDPQSELAAGYTFTTLGVTVDHELQRNVLLQGRGSFLAAEFLNGGGATTAYTLGAGASWLINRRVRLSLDYDFTNQNGSNTSNVVVANNVTNLTTSSVTNLTSTASSQQLGIFTSGSYTRNVLLLGLHLRL